MNKNRIIQGALGLAIAGGALYIFFRGFDPQKLLREIARINPAVLLACSALAVLSLFFRSLRWRLLLPELTDASKNSLFDYTVIGFMVNNIVPARLGEAARAFLLWKRNGYGVTTSAGSLVIERLIDVAVYSSFLAVPVVLLPGLDSLLPVALVIFAGVGFAAATLFWYTRQPATATKAAVWLANMFPDRFQPRLQSIGREIASTIDWAFSARKAGLVLLYSLLTSSCYPLIILLLYGDVEKLGLLGSMFAQAAASVGAAIPLAPGYVGTLHSMMLQGLSMLGIVGDRARALAILFHAVNYIPVTLAGLWLYFKMNLSMQEISAARRQMEQP